MILFMTKPEGSIVTHKEFKSLSYIKSNAQNRCIKVNKSSVNTKKCIITSFRSIQTNHCLHCEIWKMRFYRRIKKLAFSMQGPVVSLRWLNWQIILGVAFFAKFIYILSLTKLNTWSAYKWALALDKSKAAKLTNAKNMYF